MSEEWRDIEGYEGFYEVSSLGRVRSVDRVTRHGRKRVSQIREARVSNTVTPYLRVTLHLDRTRKTFSVHRLVCEAFHGPPPEGKPWGLHRNGNSLENTPENLYWGSPTENAQDRDKHGTTDNGRSSRKRCIRDHEFTTENTYVNPDGRRQCRICSRMRYRRFYRRSKGQPE